MQVVPKNRRFASRMIDMQQRFSKRFSRPSADLTFSLATLTMFALTETLRSSMMKLRPQHIGGLSPTMHTAWP
jgi:hypothetical protein